MAPQSELPSPEEMAAEIDAAMQALPVQNSANKKAVICEYSRQLEMADPAFVLDLGRALTGTYGYRGVPYELILRHRQAFQSLGPSELEEFGRGIDSWSSVDGFARLLSGPAWRDGLVSDELIHDWAVSEDRWWRRAALVSTVALNVRSHGGTGDVPRTLAICRLLIDDHDDMVVKAMSWALRELVVHDPEAVRQFLAENDDRLAARVKREVRNKLTTGRKTPPRKRA